MDLKYQIEQKLGKDRRSSVLTQYKNRGQISRLCDRIQSKYGLEKIGNLKAKHLRGVFNDLKSEGKSATTLASYATAARKIAQTIDKKNIFPRTNKEMGISRAGERLKPVYVDAEKMQEITKSLYKEGRWLGLASEMRQAFGLRSKESLLSNEISDQGELIVKGAKGGRPRTVPILTEQQRQVVVKVRQYIVEKGLKSLIPPELSLKKGLKAQANALAKVGASKENQTNAHAQRHAYAQKRIEDGVSRKGVSEELGHGREDVVSHYVNT